MEVFIAVFIKDGFVRPFVGDVLVVLLIYSFVRTFVDVRNHLWPAVCVLAFACLVEVGQYFEMASRLGLADNRIATIIIGTSFDWRDLLAYTVGFILILAAESVSR